MHGKQRGSHTSQEHHGVQDSPDQMQTSSSHPSSRVDKSSVDVSRRPSGQSYIAQTRGNSVAEQFGMITPPDGIEANNAPFHKPEADDDEQTRINDKSEKARKAANKRHAKEKSRRVSVSVPESSGFAEDEVEGERKEQYREKNKIAAAKCRNKKRKFNDEIETQAKDLEGTNKSLKAELMDLRNVVIALKDQILQHNPQDCNCKRLHEYSMGQAARMLQSSQAHRMADDSMVPQFAMHTQQMRSSSMMGISGQAMMPQANNRRMFGSLSDHMAAVTMANEMSMSAMSQEMMHQPTCFASHYNGMQSQFMSDDDMQSIQSSAVTPVDMNGFPAHNDFAQSSNDDGFRGMGFGEPWEFMQ